MNIHTRLVGVIDAAILSLTAATTFALLYVLLSPPADHDGLAEHYSVTIEQLPT